MTDVLVIARREVADKRLIFVAAAAFAVISLLIPFVPGVHGAPRDLITASSGFLSLGFMLAVATLLGGNIVGREITAGRMSFYFARPLSGASIWFGKVAAALLLVISSYLIVALPALLFGSHSSIWRIDNVPTLAVFAGFAAALFIGGHAIGTMVRSRSALIAIDFVAAAATAFFGWLVVRPLLDGAAVRALVILAWAGGTALVIAFIAAGAWQLIDGRTDRRRSHAAFSKVLWAVIGAFLIIAGAFSAWVASATPADMDYIAVESAAGNTALISGKSEHRFGFGAKFLMNTTTGEVERLGGGWRWEGELSRDGSSLLLLHRNSYSTNAGEITVRSAKTGSTVVETSIMANGTDAMTISDDGSRLAVMHAGVLNVYDVAQKRSLGSVRLESWPSWMFFTTRDSLRLYTQSVTGARPTETPRTITMYEYDAVSRTLRKGGSMTVNARYVRLAANADASRLIVSGPPSAPVLCDGKTLQTIATVPTYRTAMFLRDGRMAFVTVDVPTTKASLVVTEANGAPQRTIDLGNGSWAYRAVEVAPGKVVVDLAFRSPNLSYRAVSVDVDHGVIREGRDLVAAERHLNGIIGDPRSLPEQPVQLMTTAEKSLVSWNALTGEKKTLVAVR